MFPGAYFPGAGCPAGCPVDAATAAALFRGDGTLGPSAADAIGSSLPFVATQAFIRRGLGLGVVGGPVDRYITSEPPQRFMYNDNFAGSRPPVYAPGFGPQIPDTLTPGMDNYLTSVVYPGAVPCSAGGAVLQAGPVYPGAGLAAAAAAGTLPMPGARPPYAPHRA
jgi:hypothetical protein